MGWIEGGRYRPPIKKDMCFDGNSGNTETPQSGIVSQASGQGRDENEIPHEQLVLGIQSAIAEERTKHERAGAAFNATGDMTTIRAKLGHLTECDSLMDP